MLGVKMKIAEFKQQHPKLVKYLRDTGQLKESDILDVEVSASFKKTTGYAKTSIDTGMRQYRLIGNGFVFEIECDSKDSNITGKFVDESD